MPRRFLRRLLPTNRWFRDHPRLRGLGARLHDPALWHLNRHSVSGGVGVGLFVAWVPLPFQMLIAAIGALALRVHLPLAVLAVWVTNPLTIPPMYMLAVRTGSWLLGREPKRLEFQFSVGWLGDKLADVWAPLLLGCLVLGVISALAGVAATRLLWRVVVVRSWLERRARRRRAARRGAPLKGTECHPPGSGPDPSAPRAGDRG
jgi:hypothetical protein